MWEVLRQMHSSLYPKLRAWLSLLDLEQTPGYLHPNFQAAHFALSGVIPAPGPDRPAYKRRTAHPNPPRIVYLFQPPGGNVPGLPVEYKKRAQAANQGFVWPAAL